jgi:hypothetical protein
MKSLYNSGSAGMVYREIRGTAFFRDTAPGAGDQNPCGKPQVAAVIRVKRQTKKGI